MIKNLNLRMQKSMNYFLKLLMKKKDKNQKNKLNL